MGSWWDDFSNNLATDLGPLISLFGEAPTKQYLSECLTWADIIIFATCPLGIITAIVSAIRVCGSPSLRAFIGRAQEGAGVAEAELCSSTSRDVCELFSNNGGIVRVLGSPKLLEFFYHPGPPHEDFRQHDQKSRTAGLYLPIDYFIPHGRSESEWALTRCSFGATFAPSPNISLNVGIKPRSGFWFAFAACLGFSLQSFVLIWASIARYTLGMIRKDYQDLYAVPFIVIGTILNCMGMGLCAALVEGSTAERTFTRKRATDSRSWIFWLQPGGQRVGDQVFDAFSYTHPDGEPATYTTSSKKDRPVSKSNIRLWTAILVTIIGFLMQFLGLRACHSSVAVVQLGVVLIMSLVRASLRTKRLNKEDNLFSKDPDGVQLVSSKYYQGHELDWVALEIARKADRKPDLNNPSTYKWRVMNTQKFPVEISLSGNMLDAKAPLKVFAYRARLAQLTGLDPPPSLRNARTWDDSHVKVRKAARNLAQAIQRSVNVLFDSKAAHPVVLKKGWRDRSKFFWAIEVSLGVDKLIESTIIHLSMERDASSHDENSKGSWVASVAELEAILGLWCFSLKRDSSSLLSPLTINRVISINPKDESELNLWRVAGDSEMRETKVSSPLHPNALWVRQDGAVKEAEEPLLSVRAQIFFGLYLLPIHVEGPMTILETPLGMFTLGRCVQEIYSLFLVSILQIVENIGGQTIVDRESGRLVNDNVSSLLSAFTSHELGSSGDAFSCIIPALKVDGHLPKAQSLYLKYSIDAGLQDMAIRMLKHVDNPDAGDNDNWTPLMSAAGKGYGNVVKALLATGKVDGWGALQASVQKGDRLMAETILKIGQVHPDPDPQRLLDRRASLLQVAAERESEDIVDLLLFWNASPDMMDERGWTPLCVAVGKGNQHIASKLLQTGKVDVNLRYPEGRRNMTLLQVAIEGELNEVARELLKTGNILDVDARDQEGHTPLFAAAEKGQEEIIKLLLATGRVDIKAATIHGWTPLTIALDKGFSQTAKILINSKSADLNAVYPSGRPGRSLLQAVIEAGFNDVAELLISNTQVSVNREAQDGWSPLFAAAERGQTHLVQLLLARDVDPSIKHERGWTPLSVAVDKGYSETVELLLKTGQVNPNDRHPSSRASMVQVATDEGFEDTLRILLEVGKADPDVKSRDSWTPLGRATRWGKENIVRMLLKTGQVDLSYRSPKGESLLELAEKSWNKEVIRLMKEAIERIPGPQEQEVQEQKQGVSG